jgi:hypothetical protein
MDDNMTDDIEKMYVIVNVSYIDWMMKWIYYMLKETFNYL